MAIVIEGFTVVVRNSVLDAKYPGGRTAFAADTPNATYCNDGFLSRVAFMHSEDAQAFIADLEKKGLQKGEGGQALDLALLTPSRFLEGLGCSWLVFATFQEIPIAWLDGEKPTPIVGPPGYVPGRKMEFVTPEEAKRLVYLRTEDGVEVYRDKTTAKEMFVGRTSSD